MKKLLNKKGFTLMEMLIVVAIIVILVAISVPTFTSQLNKAREAADLANIRAAKASATTEYLALADERTEFFDDDEATDPVATRYYDAENGVLLKAASTNEITAYGKSAEEVAGAEEEPKDNILQVVIDKDGNVKCTWVTPDTAKGSTTP